MFENLDDPRKQMLLAMAAGLLTPTRAKGGAALGQAMAQGIQGGLLGYTGAQRTQEAVKRGEMDRKMMQERLDAARKAQEAQDYMAQGVQKFMQPGGPGNAPSDGMGPVMPPQQPSFDRQGFAGYLAQNPATALKAPEFLPQAQAPQFKVVGNSLVKIQGDQASEVYRPPEQKKDWQDPAWVETQMKLRKAGAPSVSVGMPAQENAFQKEYGKTLAESYGILMKSDVSAASALNNLSRLESLLKSSGNTGKATPAILELKKLGASFGIEVDEKADFQQAAQALSNQMALELRNPSGGAGMPGALSDKDREFLVGMGAGIDKTPGGNALIIETRRRLAKREREVAKMARDYRKRNGQFDEGFYSELASYSEKNPLFADLIGTQGQAAPAGGFVSPEAEAVYKQYMGGR